MYAATFEQSGLLSQFLPINERFGFRPEIPTPGYRVLIVERNVALARLLATGLAAERFSVDVSYEMPAAIREPEIRPYDLVILGMDSAELDGMSQLQAMRARWPEARVLALGGQTGVEGLVQALDQGADDYLFKPFSLIELMARVRALRRRTAVAAVAEAAPRSNKLVLHRDQFRVERAGRSIDLTPREFALLEVLIQNAGKTLSRAVLTQQVWNMPAEANTNIVDVYIKYLRDKIDGEHEEKLIRTVRGMGYLIQAQ